MQSKNNKMKLPESFIPQQIYDPNMQSENNKMKFPESTSP